MWAVQAYLIVFAIYYLYYFFFNAVAQVETMPAAASARVNSKKGATPFAIY